MFAPNCLAPTNSQASFLEISQESVGEDVRGLVVHSHGQTTGLLFPSFFPTPILDNGNDDGRGGGCIVLLPLSL